MVVHVGLLFNKPPDCAGMPFFSLPAKSYELSSRSATVFIDEITFPFLRFIIQAYELIHCYFSSHGFKIREYAWVNSSCGEQEGIFGRLSKW